MKPGDIHRVQLPGANGHEQAGRRPGIILQDDAYGANLPLVLVVPLTSTARTLRFPATVRIEPTSENGLDQTSVALVFQTRGLDRKRIQEKIGILAGDDLTAIHVTLDRLMGRA
jgi:mRNA interferase MazF